MKYVHFMRMSKKLMDSPETVEAMVKRNHKELIRKYSQKSHVWIGPFEVLLSDQDMDNFVRNLVTIRTTGNLYKAPRIAVKPIKGKRNSDKSDSFVFRMKGRRRFFRIHKSKGVQIV